MDLDGHKKKVSELSNWFAKLAQFAYQSLQYPYVVQVTCILDLHFDRRLFDTNKKSGVLFQRTSIWAIFSSELLFGNKTSNSAFVRGKFFWELKVVRDLRSYLAQRNWIIDWKNGRENQPTRFIQELECDKFPASKDFPQTRDGSSSLWARIFAESIPRTGV